MKRKHLALLILVMVISIALASMTYQRRIPSTGIVKTVGVEAYWNVGCTQNVTLIDWGTLYASLVQNVTIYVKNTSNGDANLTLTTQTWTPSNASTFLTLTWNYNGTLLHQNEVRQTVLFLAVSDSITGITNFSFDIIITAMI